MTVVFALLVSSYVCYALAPSAAFAAISIICLGAAAASSMTTMMYIIQRDAPHAQRGRILSIMQALSGLGYAIGLVMVGALGDAFGMRVGLLCAALLFTTLTLLVIRRLSYWRNALDHAHQQHESVRPARVRLEVATGVD